MRFLIVSVFLFASCVDSSPLSKEESQSAERIRYASHARMYNPGSEPPKFYLMSYLELNQDGNVRMIVSSKNPEEPLYYTGSVNKTLFNECKNILMKSSTDSFYMIKPEGNYLYSGYHYSLHYEGADKSLFTFFIPPEAPQGIQGISQKLDSLIQNGKFQRTMAAFTVQPYIDTLDQIDNRVVSPPPIIDRKTPFLPPRIRKDSE